MTQSDQVAQVPDIPESSTTLRDLLGPRVRRGIYAVLGVLIPVWSAWCAIDTPPRAAMIAGSLTTVALTGAGFGLAHANVDD